MQRSSKNDLVLGLSKAQLVDLRRSVSEGDKAVEKIDSMLRKLDANETHLEGKETALSKIISNFRDPHSWSFNGIRTVSWRTIVLFGITPAVSYVITHKLKIAVEFTAAEFAVKLPAQIIHDKLWMHVLKRHGWKVNNNKNTVLMD